MIVVGQYCKRGVCTQMCVVILTINVIYFVSYTCSIGTQFYCVNLLLIFADFDKLLYYNPCCCIRVRVTIPPLFYNRKLASRCQL
jgi:hypothetical protein